jgi:hypothetical protein
LVLPFGLVFYGLNAYRDKVVGVFVRFSLRCRRPFQGLAPIYPVFQRASIHCRLFYFGTKPTILKDERQFDCELLLISQK